MEFRDRVARYLAEVQSSDFFYAEIDRWESMDRWEQDAYPDEYPEMAYEDREQFRDYADRLIQKLGLEKWNDGPANSMERFMTRWFDKNGS